jgi:D-alanyl-D-alanine carboxypeptidase (penicillin-binding protein 5/6)
MSPSPARVIGIAVGTLAILAVGVYGPAMLLGPLPAVTVRVDEAQAAAAEPAVVVLPDDGASAVAILAESGEAELVASFADDAPAPIGGAAKLVTALVTVDSLPLEEGTGGPDIRIGAADYSAYLKYQAEGSRALAVSPGETWNERDVLRALVLASSNNHADTLATWSFGSVENYVREANGWLEEQGFATLRVADATGLSGENVGTAAELARLAGLVLADPTLGPMFLVGEGPLAADDRRIPDVIAHLGGDGIRAMSRSYTDEAALSFVFTAEIEVGDQTRRLVGAMTGVDDYETLDPAVLAVVESMQAASAPIEIIAAGASYGEVQAAWGERARLVASAARTDAAFGVAPDDASVAVEPFTTAAAGRQVGTVTVRLGERDVSSALELDAAIRDPGPVWRLTHPGELIGAFLEGTA